MAFFGRRKPAPPVRAKVDRPTTPGAWLFAFRSTPRHFEEMQAAIESTGEARVWFGETLSYIKGQGVSLFRIEATGFGWLEPLYTWWEQTERDDAVGFDVNLFVHNTRWLGSIRGKRPGEVEELIRRNAPRFEGAAVPSEVAAQ